MKLFLSFLFATLMVICGKAQFITVIQPNGGEKLYACDQYTIKFNATGTSTYYNIDYSLNNGSTWTSSATNLLITNGQYLWTVPKVNSNTCLLRLRDKNDTLKQDVSDNVFSINIPVKLTSPVGGESWVGNSVHPITWDMTGTSGKFNLSYSTNNGTSWTTIVSNYTTSTGTYSWTVPNTPSTQCLVRVVDAVTGCKLDISPLNFTITPAQPVVTYPDGGESLEWDQSTYIYWDQNTFYSAVRIEFSSDSGATWSLVTNSTANTGYYYYWYAPQITSNKCLIKVSNTADLTLYDISDAVFSIRRPLIVVAPNGGDTLIGCNTYAVKLTKSPYTSGTIFLSYSTNNTSWVAFNSFNNLSSTGSTYSYNWIVPNTVNSNTVKVKAYNSSYTGMADTSDNYFVITPNNAITVTQPNGGESIGATSNYTIKWTNTAQASGLYTVQYSSNNGSTWTTLASNISGNSYVWTNVPNVPTTTYLVRVQDFKNTCKSDVSDANFTVTTIQPLVTYPDGGEILDWDQSTYIYWDQSTFYSAVRIEFSSDSGATWSLVTSSTANTGYYYYWYAPQITSNKCLIKVSNTADLTLYDISDAVFSIRRPLMVVAPNGGDTLIGCNTYAVKLTKSPYTSGTIFLSYSTNNTSWVAFNSFNNLSSTGSTYSYNWIVPNTVNSNTVKVKAYNSSYTGMADTSDNYFVITPNNAITVTQPNGGESIGATSNYTIKWTNTAQASGLYTVQYSSNNGSTWTTLASNISGNSYVWTNVPNVPTTTYLVRVQDFKNTCKSDVSDANFTVTTIQPLVTYPDGGEILDWDQSTYIYWDQSTFFSAVRIEFSSDSGATWSLVTNSTANTGYYYYWYAPQITSNKCLIKVSNTADLTLYDISDAVFSIRRPLMVVAPNGGDTLIGCNTYAVKLTKSPYTSGTIFLSYSTNNTSWVAFNSFNNLSSTGSTYSYNWIVPNTVNSNTVKVKAYNSSYTGMADTSDNYFVIKPNNAITVTQPNGGESIGATSNYTIKWTNTAQASGLYTVQYSSNNGSTWTTLASNISGNSYVWTNVPNVPTNTYLVRVQDFKNTCKSDVSDANFTVTTIQPLVTYPDGGEILDWDQSTYIYWDQSTFYSAVRIEFSSDSGATWSLVTNSTANTGYYYYWYAPQITSNKCLIKVSNTADLTLYDISDAVFSIKRPLIVVAPNGGDTLIGCNTYAVKLTKSPYTSGTIFLSYSTNNTSWVAFNSFNNLSSTGSTYSYNWIVPNTVNSNTVKVKAYNSSYTGMADTSDNYFVIKPNNAITVTQPNGGESIGATSNYTIKWTNTAQASGLYTVQYSSNNGSTWTTLASNISGNSYVWTNVPNVPTTTYLVRVQDFKNTCKSDVSDANFTVTTIQPLVTYPDGGEILDWDQSTYIYWDQSTFYSAVRIEFSSDSGATWSLVTNSTANTGYYYYWYAPQIISSKCLIKVSNTADLTLYDISDAVFSIKRPLIVVAPNGGDTLIGCNTYAVKLTKSPYTSGTIFLSYSTNNTSWVAFNSFNNLSSSGSTYSYNWIVPNTVNSNTVKIKAYNSSYTGMADTSDNYFTIIPNNAITVTQPNGGESIGALTNYTIKWTNTAQASGLYTVQYSSNNGTTWTTLASNISSNSYVWTNIPNVPTTTYLVRVQDFKNTCKSDVSDANFTITPAQPILTYPDGGEVLWSGNSTYIYWDQTTFYSPVRLEYSLDSGSTWNLITASTSNIGYYYWTVPEPNGLTKKCLVKASNTANLNLFDISDATFTIKPAITIITPNGGDVLGSCTQTSITFEKSPAYPNVRIEYSINNGATWSYVTAVNFTTTTCTYNWTIPNLSSTSGMVRIYPTGNVALADKSDSIFTIKKAVTVLQPTYGGVIKIGDIYPIRWSSDGISNLYDIAYSIDGGTTFTNIVIGYNTANNYYPWTVPNIPSSNCYIRIRDNINSCKQDISQKAFIISPTASPINVTKDNGNDTLYGCQSYQIKWSETGTPVGLYDIYYSTDGANTWNTIATKYATTTGTYNWVVPNVNTELALFKIASNANTTLYDLSDAAFTIMKSKLTGKADTTVCSGTAVQLFVNGGVGTYQWSPTINLSDSTSATPILNAQTTQTYIASSTNGTCVLYDTVKITVTPSNATPTATISSSISGQACFGQNIGFTVNTTYEGTSPIYQWYVNNVLVSTAKSFASATSKNKDSVWVVLTSNAACTTTPTAKSNVLVVNMADSAKKVNQNLVGCASVVFNGKTYTVSTIVKDTLKNINGCDSIYTTTSVQIAKITPSTLNTSLSSCGIVVYNGITYTTSTVLNDTVKSYLGCDSLYKKVTISINPITPTTLNSNFSSCDKVVYNSITYTASTVVRDTVKSVQGCDSVYKIATISINPITATTVSSSLNSCKSVVYKGITYTASTIIRDTVKSVQGCDSIYQVATISINPVIATTLNSTYSSCDKVVYNGITYTASTVVKDTVKSVGGCDSVYKVATITITPITPTTLNSNFSSCDKVVYNGITYTASTVVKDTVKSVGGCDSVYKVATITITPITPTTLNNNFSSCNKVVYNGITYTASTLVKDTLRSVQGCDSMYKVATITITPITPTTLNSNFSSCNKVVYNGITYTASTVVKDTLKSVQGCDSVYKVATITITPITPTTLNSNFSSCSKVVYNGITYTASTVVKDTLKSVQGCDSVYKVATITINPITPITLNSNFSSCDKVVYNGVTYTASTVVRDTVKSIQGCDSLYKIASISINPITVTTENIPVTGCGTVTYKGITYNASAIVKDTLKSVEGCDSVYQVITLTVTAPLTPSISITASSTIIIAGSSVTFTASASNEGAAPTYQWQKNGVNIAGANSATYITAALVDKDTIGVVLTTSLACVSSTTAASNTLVITVNAAQYTLSGSVKNPQGKVIPNVIVSLNGSSPQTVSGNYSYNVAPDGNYSIKVSKNNDVVKSNGVSALDILNVQAHILNKLLFNSPFKIIAADVNNDGSVTTIDILFIKRLILGIDSTFKGNRLWAFVDSSYAFPSSTNPFPYKDSLSFTNLSGNQAGQSFIGVKLGDVNFNWDPATLGTTRTTTQPVELVYQSAPIQSNLLRIPVKVTHFQSMLGMQYTINYNPSEWQLTGVENNRLNIDYATTHAAEGKVSFLWTDEKLMAQTLADSTELMTLVFQQIGGNKTDAQLRLSSDITAIEAWDADYKRHEVVLKAANKPTDQLIASESYTVSPNPTEGKVVLQLNLNETKPLQIVLTDVNGRNVYQQKIKGTKGSSQIAIDLKKDRLLPSGTYYWQVIGMNGENTQKLLVK